MAHLQHRPCVPKHTEHSLWSRELKKIDKFRTLQQDEGDPRSDSTDSMEPTLTRNVNLGDVPTPRQQNQQSYSSSGPTLEECLSRVGNANAPRDSDYVMIHKDDLRSLVFHVNQIRNSQNEVDRILSQVSSSIRRQEENHFLPPTDHKDRSSLPHPK
jgi:hypothetical protein